MGLRWIVSTALRFAVVAVVTPACSILPPEPHGAVRLSGAWGLVSADTEVAARRLAEHVEEVLDVYREIEGFESRPLRIHLTRKDIFPDGFVALTVNKEVFGEKDGWVAVAAQSDRIPNTVAHELAHFYFDDAFSVFPTVLEEGLCQLLADQVFPASELFEERMLTAAAGYLDDFTVKVSGKGAKQRLAYLVKEVSPIEEVLALDWLGHQRADPRTSDNNYGFGWVLARVIGFEGLLELARRSRAAGLEQVPTAWILKAADLEPDDQDSLYALFARAMGEEPRRGQTLTITLTGSEN